jgi:hypothetical protein
MNWGDVDLREKQRKAAANAHREALRKQQEELRTNKQRDRFNDIVTEQKLAFGESLLADKGFPAAMDVKASDLNNSYGNRCVFSSSS